MARVAAPRRLLLAGITVGLLTLGACRSETGSGAFNPAPTTLPGWLQVGGPPRMQPGVTVSLTAHVVQSGQPDVDVTRVAQWTTHTADVLSVEPGGRVRGLAVGEGAVEVRFQEYTARFTIHVIADGTYVVKGVVWPLPAGRHGHVEAIDQHERSRTVETSSAGTFSLIGLSGRTRVTARVDGFAPRSADLDVRADIIQNFTLALDVNGPRWRLEVVTSETCEEHYAFPQVRMSADVMLLLVDEGLVVLTPVAQPDLIFRGEPTSAGFDILLSESMLADEYQAPGVRMRTNTGAEYELLGWAMTRREGAGYAGTADAVVQRVPGTSDEQCWSDRHQLTLQRR